MMMMVIVPTIIIIIIVGMSIPNTQSRPKNAGGNHCKKPEPTPCHRRGGGKPPQADPPPNRTTPQGGGKQPTTQQGVGTIEGGGGGGGGGDGRTGIIQQKRALQDGYWIPEIRHKIPSPKCPKPKPLKALSPLNPELQVKGLSGRNPAPNVRLTNDSDNPSLGFRG